MLGIVKEINGEKTIIPLTTDTGTGNPVIEDVVVVNGKEFDEVVEENVKNGKEYYGIKNGTMLIK